MFPKSIVSLSTSYTHCHDQLTLVMLLENAAHAGVNMRVTSKPLPVMVNTSKLMEMFSHKAIVILQKMHETKNTKLFASCSDEN